VLATAADAVFVALNVLVGAPDSLREWLLTPLVLIPVSQVLAAATRGIRTAELVLVESIVVAGLAALVVAVYLVVVVGLGRAPVGAERDVLLASIFAAIIVAALALPVRHRLVSFGTGLIARQDASAEEVVATFGARMTRAVPMDELMLQLAESLRATVATAGAEVWVGTDGVLTRTVSVPNRPAQRLELGAHERVVVGRARIGGPSWSSVWLPQLVHEPGGAQPREAGASAGDLRVAPAAHLGELLGLVVVRRSAGDPPFSEDDERLLVDLSRQLGLALHNVRLDSALQKSLDELQQRNAELQASRLRIVTASDDSRRAIERNLHDGAQQHLVALAVKLGLARHIVEEDPELVTGMLEELRIDVQTTIRELRELAHGIYPPLLRDRGLGEALRTAAARSPLPCSVVVDLPGRYPEEAETTAYFCCLEALQNAGKYAGEDAEVTVRVGRDGPTLWFRVTDDGAGITGPVVEGHGFVNMRDRLGAIGGELSISSEPGSGTTVEGRIPVQPLAVRPANNVTPLQPATASVPLPVPPATPTAQDEIVSP
jgi:signal transduction histidine kinase